MDISTFIQNLFGNKPPEEIKPALSDGLNYLRGEGNGVRSVVSPVDGKELAKVQLANLEDYRRLVALSEEAFLSWREVPAPKRGEIVRQIGEAFRKAKDTLGGLVSYEMGKSYQEGLGEVQEIIDICDFAVGLSRQLYGITTQSERPNHRLYEQWRPLGVVGVISAFNFPVAVWAWNAMLSAVCGNVTLWKPSEKTPLCALACMNIISDVLKRNDVPPGVFTCIVGDAEIGKALAADPQVALVSATGSTAMGHSIGTAVAQRFGKSLLELGGNNAVILSDKADLSLALTAIVFAAVGTAGQRCTTARRLIVHENIYEDVKARLLSVYAQLKDKVGNPILTGALIGPLIDAEAVANMQNTLKSVQEEGGKLLIGGEVLSGKESNNYVSPALVEVESQTKSVKKETFAPILYMMKYKTLEEAIRLQNDVPQGLSSSIFTTDMREMEYFLSEVGSDCGIANVNIGPSGAEIGGAFGGEKETGGGRESGSDAWKAYMRRQTVTINYGSTLTLAQGIKFDL